MGRNVVTPKDRLYMRMPDPESSNSNQCYAHDNCTSAGEPAVRRKRHPLHNTRPRRNPHERLDRSKKLAAVWAHNVAPTKNFVFDSHWQQSRNIRWRYIWARKPLENSHRHPPNCCVASGVVVMVLVLVLVLVVVRKIREVLRVIQPAMELR